MSKLLKKQVTELLEYDATLADDKLLAYVKHLWLSHNLDIVEQYAVLKVIRKCNPESFFRAWRQAQELNPELRGKDYDKRHAQEVKVRHDMVEDKHEPDVYKITEVVARQAEQAELFFS
jgi:hypothetical protein